MLASCAGARKLVVMDVRGFKHKADRWAEPGSSLLPAGPCRRAKCQHSCTAQPGPWLGAPPFVRPCASPPPPPARPSTPSRGLRHLDLQRLRCDIKDFDVSQVAAAAAC